MQMAKAFSPYVDDACWPISENATFDVKIDDNTLFSIPREVISAYAAGYTHVPWIFRTTRTVAFTLCASSRTPAAHFPSSPVE
ncbi:MAG TPA: hypothetical protein VM847_13315 [Tahibacter sp.]|nr:hypothetical protein [Tahibacter sp.]